jgi:hypothetical protein
VICGRAAVAGALACAFAAAGCGIGPGPSIGDVKLTVTKDYGSDELLRRDDSAAHESDSAMRVLDRNTDISTRYGGGFVESIDGISGATRGGDPYDWFFYVNGVESPIGASDYELHGGDRVWWDYRDWSAAMRVPAVVGSFPEPFAHGYGGESHPVKLECEGGSTACGLVNSRIAPYAAKSHDGDPIRVLTGTWDRVRGADAAAAIEHGPAYSGVFADFVRRSGTWRLQPLDVGGDPSGPPEDAGLVAATRHGDDPPVWVITGPDQAAVLAAARKLDPTDLRDRYAVAVSNDEAEPLPAR